MHSGSVECLAVGIDAPFSLRANGFGERKVRSALIPARTPNRIVAQGERMLFCYFDPGSVRARECRSRMSEEVEGIGVAHAQEEQLLRLAAGPDVDPQLLLAAATGGRSRPIDPRIAQALQTIRSTPANLGAGELANAAHLSNSRFLHLFSDQAGTSFRRYRLWARMLHVGSAVSKGKDFTTAATDAGFASPSHFSDAFHAMFGLAPSALLAGGVRIEVFDR